MERFTLSLAVVIGINDYQSGVSPLRTAVADAEAVGQLLEQAHGYTVWRRLDTNATRDHLVRLFEQELPEAFKDAAPGGSRLLIYYAGHGLVLRAQTQPEGVLLPQDAQAASEQSFLSMRDVYRWLSALPCHHLLVVLDCCFAATFRWANRREAVVADEVMYEARYEHLLHYGAAQVLTSAAHDEKALDVVGDGYTLGRRERDGQAHSPFAQALLEGLRAEADRPPPGATEGDGLITATDLYVYLQDLRLQGAFGAQVRQTPGLSQFEHHEGGEFLFRVPGRSLALTATPALSALTNPYRGLKSFQAEDAALFFGRERLARALAERVHAEGLTGVVGPSGTGKSSLVMAGLLPLLAAARPPAPRWDVLGPLRPEGDVGAAVARATEGLLGRGAATPSLSAAVATWLERHPEEGARLLVVVDPWEELFTRERNPGRRARFLTELSEAAEHPSGRVRVVGTLRLDSEWRVSAELGERWNAARMLLAPMERDELRAAIVRPASSRALFFEPPTLVERLLDEMASTPGALPLLSFTLSELYDACLQKGNGKRTLRESDYLDLGGVRGALWTRADRIHEALSPAHRDSMRRLMLRLIATDAGEAARRRVPLSELEFEASGGGGQDEDARVRDVREQLVDARLLVSDGDSVEPAHDALLGWPRLLAWRDEARPENLLLQRRVRQATNDWMARERADALLWAEDGRLPMAEQLRRADRYWFNRAETEFLTRSTRRHAALERRNRLITATVMTVLSVAALVLLFLRWVAEDRRQESLARALAARAESLAVDPGARRLVTSTLLGIESLRRHPTPEGDQAVRRGLAMIPPPAAWSERLGPLLDVAFSTDSRRAAAITTNGMAVVVNLATREKVSTLTDGASAADVGPVTGMLAVARGSEVLLWSRWDGPAPSTPRIIALGNPVDRLRFSPLERWLVVSVNGREELRDIATGARCSWLPEGPFRRIFVGPDEHFLALEDAREHLRLWDAVNQRQVGPPARDEPGSAGRLVRVLDDEEPDGARIKLEAPVAFSPDGRLLASATTGSELMVYRLDSWTVQLRVGLYEGARGFFSESIQAMAFSMDSRTLAVGTGFGSVRLYDTGNKQGHRSLFEPDRLSNFQPVSALAFDPSGERLMVGLSRAAGTALPHVVADARLWRIMKGNNPVGDSDEELEAIETGVDGVSRIRFSPSGDWGVTWGDRGLRVWHLHENEEAFRWREPSIRPQFEQRLAWSPTGSLLAASVVQGRLDLFSARSRRLLRSLSLGRPSEDGSMTSSMITLALRFDPGGQTLLALMADGTLRRWTTGTWKELEPRRWMDEPPVKAAFSENGAWAVLALPKTLQVVSLAGELTAWRPRRSETGAFVFISALGISDDGDRVSVIYDDGRSELFSLRDASPGVVLPLPADAGRLTSSMLALSPDGTRLVVSAGDGNVWRMDAERGTYAPTGPIRFDVGLSVLRFSPEGTRFVGAGVRGRATVWNADGSPALSLTGHLEEIEDAAFSPEGRWLATAAEGVVRIHRLRTDDLIAAACARLRRNLSPAEWADLVRDGEYQPTCEWKQ